MSRTVNRRSRMLLLFLLVAIPTSRGQDSKPADDPRLLALPRSEYVARRAALIDRLAKLSTPGGESVVILQGGDDRDKEDFEEGRFRQNANFAYLTGVDVPGAYLVILPKRKKATLYLPPKGAGPPLGGGYPHAVPGKEAAKKLGFENVESTGRLLGDVFAAIGDPLRTEGKGLVYVLNPEPAARDGKPDAQLVRFLKQGAPNTGFRSVAPALGELRKSKSKAEIELLQKAIDITGEANEAVIRTIRPGLVEYQLEAVIHRAFTDGGALRPGFASIVGSGPNSTIPHYFNNDRTMTDGDLVVVDIGAEYQLYTADITRTYPVNGKFTPRQREIYQLVLDAQKAAEAQVVPGQTRLLTLTQFVRDYLRKSPLRARDENGEERTMDAFFVHGLGHYLGMDVHDVGNGMTPMKPGEVFTIEPGIYIKSENIGIRIEDDYLVTETGIVKLSRGIASDPDEVEAKIARARKKGE